MVMLVMMLVMHCPANHCASEPCASSSERFIQASFRSAHPSVTQHPDCVPQSARHTRHARCPLSASVWQARMQIQASQGRRKRKCKLKANARSSATMLASRLQVQVHACHASANCGQVTCSSPQAPRVRVLSKSHRM